MSFLELVVRTKSLEIRGNKIAELRLKDVFHVSETCGEGDYILGRFTILEGSDEL